MQHERQHWPVAENTTWQKCWEVEESGKMKTNKFIFAILCISFSLNWEPKRDSLKAPTCWLIPKCPQWCRLSPTTARSLELFGLQHGWQGTNSHHLLPPGCSLEKSRRGAVLGLRHKHSGSEMQASPAVSANNQFLISAISIKSPWKKTA